MLNHKIYRRWYLVTVFCVLSSAFFATGYHHPDEYMQVIEFANYKLGGIPRSDMPWEFHEKMRPWLLPSVFYSLSQAGFTLGFENPFFTMNLFRLMWGLLGLIASVLIGQIIYERATNENSQRWGVGAAFLLFYLPWMYTRGSAESVGGIFLVFSLASVLMFRQPPQNVTRNSWLWVLSGFLIGLAFHARYHIGVMIPVIWVWMLFVEKTSFRCLFSHMSGLLMALALGLGLDWWGYEEFVLTPYNYFYQNIVLNKAAQWGTRPFWFYPFLIQENIMPVVTVLLTIFFGISIFRMPTNLIVMISTVFFLVHSLVGHKEMRFLFPIAILAPVFVSIARNSKFLSWFWERLNLKIIISLNVIALILASLWPSRAELLLQKKIWQQNASTLVYEQRNPYLLGGNPVMWTRPDRIKILSRAQFESDLPVSPFEYLYTTDQAWNLSPDSVKNCELKWRLFPSWIGSFNFNQWLERTGDWALYKCGL